MQLPRCALTVRNVVARWYMSGGREGVFRPCINLLSPAQRTPANARRGAPLDVLEEHWYGSA
eukprot:4154161-Prorocentrum_lima.AAC.1